MSRFEATIDLDDSVVEVLFAGFELPEPYFIAPSKKTRRVRATLISDADYHPLPEEPANEAD